MTDFSTRRTLQAVMPLALEGSRDGNDLARAITQGRTLRHFFRHDELLNVNVVGRAHELQQIAAALKPLETDWLRYRLLDENVVHPDMTSGPIDGWHKQQVIKMAAPEWLGAPVWLTLDADVICTKPVGIDDLLPQGRALMSVDNVWQMPNYVQWAWATREMLGMVAPPLTFAGTITPLLYTAPIMLATHQHLEALHGRPWKDVLLNAAVTREQNRRIGQGWAENMLYYTVAIRTGMLPRYHCLSGIDTPQSLICDGVWTGEDWADWDPLPAFDRTLPGFFAVCSSYTGMPAQLVADKIGPLLAQADDGNAARAGVIGLMSDENHEAVQAAPELRAQILSRNPLVLYGPYDQGGLSNLLTKGVMEPFRDMPALLLLALASSKESESEGRAIAARIARRRRELPLHRVVVLCNTEVELDILRELAVDCVLASDNVFIDERPFLVERDVVPEFDAVYNAGFHPVKRHRLAANIESLAVIFANWHKQYAEYEAASKTALAHAVFLNQPDAGADYRYFGRDELAAQLARARVGLCLSPYEGAMRASIEYLFAGLPIVSTLNRGGRDQFFDADFCVNVPPSPQLIADAVRELIKLDVPRAYVRRRTMHKLAQHRERLVHIVHRSLAGMGYASLPTLNWPWLAANRGFFSVAELHRAVLAV